MLLRAVSWSFFARKTSDLFDEESFWIQNSKWSASPLVCLWIIINLILFFSTLRLANWGQVLLAIGQVTRARCRTVGVPFCWLLPCTNASKIIIISQKVPINEVNLLMGRTISYCVWGLLTLILYLFIVVSFNQEYQYHTDIPVSIYIFVGYLFFVTYVLLDVL